MFVRDLRCRENAALLFQSNTFEGPFCDADGKGPSLSRDDRLPYGRTRYDKKYERVRGTWFQSPCGIRMFLPPVQR